MTSYIGEDISVGKANSDTNHVETTYETTAYYDIIHFTGYVLVKSDLENCQIILGRG